MLSIKLAINNLRKGYKSFAPFLMACITMFVMLFITASIALSPSIDKLRGGKDLADVMNFALVLLSVFSILILIYSYRFLQLQRSREYGLYDILGFGKTKIAGVAFFELLFSYLITIIIGTVLGIALSKFLYLIFVNMIGGNYFNLEINPISILLVAALFFVFYILLMIIASWIIERSSSLDLLQEETKGEREPKSNVFLAILALVLILAGYSLALTVSDPISALIKFFVAVFLVIVGTYFFYVSFTVWYLKRKKKRPSYYQPQNFITISSMLYRMKANAVGLANITILLSMTIVTVVVSLGVFIGTESVVRTEYPREVKVASYNEAESPELLTNKMFNLATENNIALGNVSKVLMANNISILRKSTTENTFVTENRIGGMMDKGNYEATLSTYDSLKSLGNKNIPQLKDNQVLIVGPNTSKIKSLSWFGSTYEVKESLKSIQTFPKEANLTNSMLIIFSSNQAMKTALADYNKVIYNGVDEMKQSPQSLSFFDIQSADQKRLTSAFKQSLGADNDTTLTFRTGALQDQRSQIGGYVFVGFVLGISFILGAALIIYYKQLSEGTQDKRSFKILQEVGLSKDEVQKTIKSQVRMLFFLPLIITILHYAGAYLMIEKIIMLFGISNRSLILFIGLGTIVFLMAVYYIIYKATSHVYYKIVER